MAEQFNSEAAYSPLTKHSPKPISLHQKDGIPSACANEVVLYGSGFFCMAQVVTSGLLSVRYYQPCQMKNGQCPINQYRESPLPNP